MFLEINKVHQGDARKLLKQVEPNSVSLSVWSPPYFVGKEYEKYLSYQDWVDLLTSVISLHEPILKPGGFLVVNIADILAFQDKSIPRFQALTLTRQKCSVSQKDVLEAKKKHPDYNRYQLAELLKCSEQTIDRRLNGNNIRGGKYNNQTRVHLVGDIIEKPAYKAGLYLYDRRIWKKDPCWENSKWHSLSYRSVDEFEYLYFLWKPGITTVDRKRLSKEEWKDWGSRGVWEIPSVRTNNDHEAKFPLELPKRAIRLLTSPGDVVLDCFMGSGTTAIAAINEGRNFIGIELEPKYVDLSNRKIKEVQSK
ncbi:site-specific DNA-methyltransferase [Candidatus Microgenomates bacterium]|jgi:site-specific DNA-methyltransferase (adenine-specific)|nr:MAG: site-specific DNA-methyltransferase [Candidatus Microgenomates bacterium]